MRKRTLTGIILLLVLVPIVTVEIFYQLFVFTMTLFVIRAAYEMIRMYGTHKRFGNITKIGIILLTLATFFSVAGVVTMTGETQNPLEAKDLLNITIPLLTLFLFSFLVLFKDFNGEDAGKALTIVNYVGLGAASIVILRSLGVRFIVYLFLISMLTDTFAYLIGVRFGKHKMVPDISPKKSWEGAIGGTIVATLIASTFALFYGFWFVPGTFVGDIFNATGERSLLDNFSSLGESAPLWAQGIVLFVVTLGASIFAQVGDLVASKLKRTYGIKDFGHILPGHGGLLDRFDSILFVAMFLTAVFFMIHDLYPSLIV
ncbi:MAG: phosphatidate cytidylyltransferase [Acholeplasmataceae bacterium]|nr:phosphatidate cytidylyltransferase [Acholeplasmataceae bacterium]